MLEQFKTITEIPKLDKITNYESVPDIIKTQKKNGKLVVYTSGAFDILHLGHVRYLRAAKSVGDILVVGLESDSTVANTRGAGRPINTLEARLEVISALECVDWCFGFLDSIKSYESAGSVFANRYKELKANYVVMPPHTKTDVAQKEQIMASGSEIVIVDLPLFKVIP